MFEIIKNICALIGAISLVGCTFLVIACAIGRLMSRWDEKSL